VASWSPTSCPTTAHRNYCGRIEESFGRYPTLLLAEEEDNFIAFVFAAGPPRIAWTELKRAPMPRGDFSACRSKSAWPICAGVIPTRRQFLILR